MPNAQVAENGYNLSVSSYVEAEDTRPEIDIRELNDRIRRIVAHENELRAEIDAIIAELESDTLLPKSPCERQREMPESSESSDQSSKKGGAL